MPQVFGLASLLVGSGHLMEEEGEEEKKLANARSARRRGDEEAVIKIWL